MASLAFDPSVLSGTFAAITLFVIPAYVTWLRHQAIDQSRGAVVHWMATNVPIVATGLALVAMLIDFTFGPQLTGTTGTVAPLGDYIKAAFWVGLTSSGIASAIRNVTDGSTTNPSATPR